MKLKNTIFIWVTLAGVLPLAILGIAITTYSEHRYRIEVGEQVSANLNNIVAEIDRRLYYDRQMLLSLVDADNMVEFKPVLQAINSGSRHAQHVQRSERLGRFLASFQTVVPGFKTLRIVTLNNRTLIRIRRGKAQIGETDGIQSSPFVDEENGNARLLKKLRELPANEVRYILLPQSKWDWEDLRGAPMLNGIVPINYKKEVIGFLAVSYSGEHIDNILETAQRTFRSTLSVSELNPDDKKRNGMVLYDDVSQLKFDKVDTSPRNLRSMYGGRLWEAVQRNPHGDFISRDKSHRTFYVEYLPYSSRLVSWVVASRINLDAVGAPFNRIRTGILLITLVAVIIGLFLARFGARTVSRPITRMARSMKDYADGDHTVRVPSEGADELRQLEASFNYLADNLDKAQHMMLQSAKLASIGQMAAGIGHEINNPLNNILSLIKLIERSAGEDNPKLRKDLESLREEGQRASEIIKGVLNFARQVPPQYDRFDVRPWLEDTMRLVNQAARERFVELVFQLDGDYELNGDRNQLQQVMVNLLLNAIQASERDSKVWVNAKVEGTELVVCVVDHGAGVAEEVLDKIYDPFFTTKPEGMGTGLGLSISLGIVERHNGSLKITNNSDRGVTVELRLPLDSTAG